MSAERGFKLEAAIATWRRFVRSARSISDAADELESHLRDEIDAFRRQGYTEEAAFREARRCLGDYAMLERAYRRVYWKKVRAERRLTDELRWRLSMLKNYLVIALRNLRKHKSYAALNVVGLALGIACCFVLILYVQDEVTFDAFHAHADRIYRVVEDRGDAHAAHTAGALAPMLRREVAEVTGAVRLKPFIKIAVTAGDTRLLDFDYLLAEPSFFEVFDFELLQGNPATALTEPNTTVLTERFARKLFGDADALGRTFTAGFWGEVTVTGILRDPPYNSHVQFSQLLSFATIGPNADFLGADAWESEGFITYVTLREGVDAAHLGTRLQSLAAARRTEAEARRLYLQPLKAIHFESGHIAFERNAHEGERRHLYIFSAIALLIALIACINYMNLATARSMHRAKEVGLRKVVGAQRRQLVFQFLNESLLLALLAFGGALLLVRACLPAFNALSGKALALDNSLGLWLGLTGAALLVGVVAGSYPAFYLSRLGPMQVLKGDPRAGGGRASLRRGLVVVQFALSIMMLIGTTVIAAQLDYIRQKHLGFNEEHLVALHVDDDAVEDGTEPLKQALRQQAAVRRVAASTSVPGDWMDTSRLTLSPVGEASTETLEALYLGVDEDFLTTYEIDLVAGRNFSGALDTEALLINETAARLLGWTDPVGRELQATYLGFGEEGEAVDLRGRVIGVVKDFHFESLHQAIKPMVLGHWAGGLQSVEYVTVRIGSAEVAATLSSLNAVYAGFDPDNPLQYAFLDDQIAAFYATDQQVKRVFGMAAALALLIACLGLLGLAAFAAQRRTKEIGIRKVLGASVPGLVALLSKDVAGLVGVAFLIAAPAAYVAMNRWLEGFAYRIEISWGIFLLVGSLALAIALLTVSYQAIKAALADPVKSLRYE